MPINKLIFMEGILYDIDKQMLETSYTLRLGQLLKISSKLFFLNEMSLIENEAKEIIREC